VWAESALGHGTTFRVCLPRIEEEVEQAGGGMHAAEPPRPPPPGVRLLLAEDDAGVRALMKDLLEGAGYEVAAAARPEEALALAGDRPFDLLVTDVIMPGMSGRELARRLVERGAARRVLFVSGYAGEALARHGGISAGERFLQKPFTEIGLLATVADALGDEAAGTDGSRSER
jgi:CheY-like chemotaxis protein